ncbi:MAG TPA: heme-binding protein, partial [Planctomycetota bacterium]
IQQVIESADITRAQVRLPLGSPAKVIATVVDVRGLILAHYRMEDTLCDAIDVVPAKARSVVYYCRSGGPAPADRWPFFPLADPRGIALTTRTLGFLSQPFFPPGIEGTSPGPLLNLALTNQQPGQVDRWGNAPPDPGYQNGLTFFPGSVPLYKGGELVGALGVSGDGVEQNDLIAFEGGRGFEPPPELRIDNFTFQGVRLPYVKFPQTPR